MSQKRTDVLIVLGKNWRSYRPQPVGTGKRLYLSLESKLTALAAGHLFLSGAARTLLFSSGHTAGPAWPSEADAMATLLRQRFPAIPASAIRLETVSIDTAENAELVGAMLGPRSIQDVALLTVGFHVRRSVETFRNYGLTVAQGHASEEVLGRCAPAYRPFLRRYRRSPRVRLEQAKEWLLRLWLPLDPRGRLLRLATSRLRRGGRTGP